ncbi:hypothetical protein BX661DRAFT_181134 [Kickxella alabastrina]|uniref:uncharacterized protein n=1 Tax=Kickxella alabastrina TaxID=61397 RepID=UPI0022210704|nr:uncharacterized protein BX661DRAFT_181134 [Kickxella alabastrina]KAI7830125.1 hypothetical protein BX661DRAFT_181134 [Kickxella alabastrina]
MNSLFDTLESSVDTSLRQLFPQATNNMAGTSTHGQSAHQRAQAFSSSVSNVHKQLVELKTRIEQTPELATTAQEQLHNEIRLLQQDIRLKDGVLEKHRGTLRGLAQELGAFSG